LFPALATRGGFAAPAPEGTIWDRTLPRTINIAAFAILPQNTHASALSRL